MLLAVVAVLGCGRTARAQAGDAEQGFAQRIDQERTAHGLAALAPAADLQEVARRHAQRMAERGQPYHNPQLGSEVSDWSMVGENVGVGDQVDAIHAAFMASSPHRSAILSPDFTQVGVGVHVSADARIWVVQVFRRPAAAATDPAPAAPPAPA
ncbi:MAG: CAP domain-containing protein, partial [Acidimicrobiales bacterium]